jgi:hypothetical protein
MKLRHRIFAAALCSFLVLVSNVRAQEQVDGPTALIITYHAKSGGRSAFRKVMQTEGVAQLNQWQKDGVFSGYKALFTAYAADTVPDMFLVLRFKHFTDLGNWQKIEETYPGGLTERAQTLGAAETSGTADIVDEGSSTPTTKDSQFFVLEYDVTVDMPKYVSYVHGYVTPQFKGWATAGVLSSYSCFVNQNPAGAPWSSFILLEYKDLRSLAAREVVKTKTRAQLATSDATWKKWSDDKTAVRREKAAIPVLSLN